jgi:hypothetical protein
MDEAFAFRLVEPSLALSASVNQQRAAMLGWGFLVLIVVVMASLLGLVAIAREVATIRPNSPEETPTPDLRLSHADIAHANVSCTQ